MLVIVILSFLVYVAVAAANLDENCYSMCNAGMFKLGHNYKYHLSNGCLALLSGLCRKVTRSKTTALWKEVKLHLGQQQQRYWQDLILEAFMLHLMYSLSGHTNDFVVTIGLFYITHAFIILFFFICC